MQFDGNRMQEIYCRTFKAHKAYNYFFAIAVACVVEIFTGQLLSVNNIFFYLATQTIVFFGLYYIILWILKDPIINEGYNAVREKTSSFLRFCNKRENK